MKPKKLLWVTIAMMGLGVGCGDATLNVTVDLPSEFTQSQCDDECVACQQGCDTEFTACEASSVQAPQCEQQRTNCKDACQPFFPATALRLRVYEPSPALPFSCGELAFNQVETTILRSTLKQENLVPVGGGTADFSDLNRVAPKVLLAEALDKNEDRVAVACSEVGTVESDTDLTLAFEATTILTNTSIQSGSIGTGPFAIDLLLRNSLGNALRGEVRYEIEDIYDGKITDTLTTDGQGIDTLDVKARIGTATGPVRVVFNTRWQLGEPLLVRSFIEPTTVADQVAGQLVDAPANLQTAPQAAGEVVFVTRDTSGATPLNTLHRISLTGQVVVKTAVALGPNVSAQAKVTAFTANATNNTQQVVIADNGGWRIYRTDDNSVTTATAPLTNLTFLTSQSQCGNQAPLIFAQAVAGNSQSFVLRDPTLAAVSLPALSDPNLVRNCLFLGCIREQAGVQERSFLACELNADPDTVRVFVLDATLNANTVDLPLPFGAVAQARSEGGFGPALLVTQASEQGPLAQSYQFNANQNRLSVVNEAVLDGVADQIETGEINGDNALRFDIVALERLPRPNGQTVYAIQAYVRIDDAGDTITGLLEVGDFPSPPRLVVTNVNSDTYDDIVLVWSDPAANQTKFRIYLMGPLS